MNKCEPCLEPPCRCVHKTNDDARNAAKLPYDTSQRRSPTSLILPTDHYWRAYDASRTLLPLLQDRFSRAINPPASTHLYRDSACNLDSSVKPKSFISTNLFFFRGSKTYVRILYVSKSGVCFSHCLNPRSLSFIVNIVVVFVAFRFVSSILKQNT